MTKPKMKWSKLPKNLRPVRIKSARKPNKKNLTMNYMEKCGSVKSSPMSELIYNIRKELELDNHQDMEVIK